MTRYRIIKPDDTPIFHIQRKFLWIFWKTLKDKHFRPVDDKSLNFEIVKIPKQFNSYEDAETYLNLIKEYKLEKIVVILNPDGYLIDTGDPDSFTDKELGKYLIRGFTVKTMTIDEFRKANFTWDYDKPINNG
jgi:hypothetical protein